MVDYKKIKKETQKALKPKKKPGSRYYKRRINKLRRVLPSL